jgi:hypothetical protein
MAGCGWLALVHDAVSTLAFVRAYRGRLDLGMVFYLLYSTPFQMRVIEIKWLPGIHMTTPCSNHFIELISESIRRFCANEFIVFSSSLAYLF